MNCYFMSYKIRYIFHGFNSQTYSDSIIRKNSTKNNFSRLLTKALFFVEFFLFSVFATITGTMQVTYSWSFVFASFRPASFLLDRYIFSQGH